MLIGLLAPPWLPVPPPGYGGTEMVVDGLARGLTLRGHEVLLFCTGDSSCDVPKAFMYEHAQRELLGQTHAELPHVIRGYETLRDCDIVHDHTLAGPAHAGGREHPPAVFTAHGPFEPPFGDLYGAAAAEFPMIAISHHQASTATGPVRAVIHHGIDVDSFPIGAGDGDYVCFLGRMAPYKGAREAALIAERTGTRLLLAGKMDEPTELEYFESAVRPLLNRRIEYVGELGGRERLDFLGSASALINPISWSEPFGLVMAEAMACGTPVLTTRRGAAPEIVLDCVTGRLCETVAEAIECLPEVVELDRYACRQRVLDNFSTARMVDDHIRVYGEIIAEPAASAAVMGLETAAALSRPRSAADPVISR